MTSICATAHTWGRPGADEGTSLRGFLPQWEAAQTRFINGDPALWKEHASHSDDVTILGAFGGYGERGWKEVGSRYDWASSQYKSGGATLTVVYLQVTERGDLGYTVAIGRQEAARVGGASAATRALRVTQVFRRESGAWKLVHRHADALVNKQPPSGGR
jgi:ketosteroid isomerase-like protein